MPKLTLAFFFVFLLFFALPVSDAPAIVFDDGLVHTVDSAYLSVSVYDGPGSTTTTVNIENGATVTGDIRAHDSSVLNMSGGTVFQSVYAGDGSALHMSGGTVFQSVYAGDGEVVNMSGGAVLQNV